jgi:hypothetical protein
MRRTIRIVAVLALVASTVTVAGCQGSVGVGLGVGVPVGARGRMTVGASQWF